MVRGSGKGWVGAGAVAGAGALANDWQTIGMGKGVEQWLNNG